MARNKGRVQSEMLQFFNVNEGMRKNLERSFLDFREKKKKQMQDRSATWVQMAKHLSEIQGQAKPAAGDPKTAKAVDGIMRIHEKLAKQKLAPPQVVPGPGGVAGLSYSVTLAPPYQYAAPPDTVSNPTVLGEPVTLTGSPDPTTGQVSASAVTDGPDSGYGWIDNAIGIYFTSTVPGTLNAYANPIYSYELWTESYFPSAPVYSEVDGWINVWGAVPGGPVEAAYGLPFFSLTEQKPGPLVLQDGFNVQGSASISSIPIDPSLAYIIFVSADASAFGSLNSIAGAMLSVTVPSITYEFEQTVIIKS